MWMELLSAINLFTEGIQWSVDNLISDFNVSKKESQKGTRVFCRLEVITQRDLTWVLRNLPWIMNLYALAQLRSYLKRSLLSSLEVKLGACPQGWENLKKFNWTLKRSNLLDRDL
jgi:hypothetical protein